MQRVAGAAQALPPAECSRCLACSRRWCERTVQVTEEEVVAPRREEVVPCSEVYQYNMAGWLLDQDRMHQARAMEEESFVPHRGQAGARPALCYIYK